jgi:hypothetical protein
MVELGDPITPVDPNTTGLTQHFLWDICCIHWVSISSSHIEAFFCTRKCYPCTCHQRWYGRSWDFW